MQQLEGAFTCPRDNSRCFSLDHVGNLHAASDATILPREDRATIEK